MNERVVLGEGAITFDEPITALDVTSSGRLKITLASGRVAFLYRLPEPGPDLSKPWWEDTPGA
jgi:ribosomal protein L18E